MKRNLLGISLLTISGLYFLLAAVIILISLVAGINVLYGIIFLDYNQPMTIINKIFAIFKSKEYFDKEIEVKGLYRRSPVPYVELKSMVIDEKEKKIFTYGLKKACHLIVLIAALVGLFIGLAL